MTQRTAIRQLRTLYKCPSFSLHKHPNAKKPKLAPYHAKFTIGGKPTTYSTFESDYEKATARAKVIVRELWEAWRASVGEGVARRPPVSPLEGTPYSRGEHAQTAGIGLNLAIGTENKSVVRAEIDLPALIKDWLDLKYPSESSTKETQRDAVKRWYTCMGSPKHLSELSADSVVKCHSEMRKRFRTTTMSNAMNRMKAFMDWLLDVKGLIPVNYVRKAKSSLTALKSDEGGTKLETRVNWTDKEYETILSGLNDTYKKYLKVLWHTGMATADLLTLAPEHIIEKEDGLYIRKLRQKSKGEKEWIDLPLMDEALVIVERQLNVCEAAGFKLLFNTKNRSISSLRERFAATVKAAWEKLMPKMPRKDLYSIRHTFATRHLEAGVSELVLQRWMGHTRGSKVLAEVYDHVEKTGSAMRMSLKHNKKVVAFNKRKEAKVA